MALQGEIENRDCGADPAAGVELDDAQMTGMREDHMDTPRSQPQDAPKQRKRPAGRSGHFGLAICLVALGLCGCATAPPPPTYVAGTLPPRCDSGTSECVRKNAPAPPQKAKCTGFLDLRVLYGTCTE
jgi:hypothetical protein